jgi:hypothetical protein
MILLGI